MRKCLLRSHSWKEGCNFSCSSVLLYIEGKKGGKNSLGSESLGVQSCSFHELSVKSLLRMQSDNNGNFSG